MTKPGLPPGADAAPCRPRFRQALAGLGMAALLAACGAGGTSSEVQRQASPDGALEAVIVEHNHGATTPFVHEVRVQPRGAPTDRGQRVVRLIGATRNDQQWGADVQWLSPTRLRVSYLQARQVHEQRSALRIEGRQVEITLQPGVRSPHAQARAQDKAEPAPP